MTVAPDAAVFAFGGLTIEVVSDSPPGLEWLQFFMRPWFAGAPVSARGDERTHARVEFAVDPATGAASKAVGTHVSESRPVFLLDSRLVALPAVHSAEGWVSYRDDDLGAVYETRGDGVVRVRAAGDDAGTRVALMRVVRELAMIDAVARGGVLLHASVTAIGGNAVAMCGPKRSGKTTLLLHLLMSGGAAYVANDRAVATASPNGGAGVRGLPTIVALRGDTVDRFPDVARTLRALPDRHWLTPREAAQTNTRRTVVGSPIDLAPASLCNAIGVGAVAGANLRALVFPRVDQTVSGRMCRRLTSTETIDRLRHSQVGAGLTNRRADALWPARYHVPQTDTSDALASLPSFELVLGRGAYDQPALPDEIQALVR